MSIDLSKPLDDRKISNQEKKFLSDLQANILRGHGREHVALLFLAVHSVDKARAFLHKFPVSSAQAQYEESKEFKETHTPGGVVRLAFLTKAGLDKFGHGGKFTTSSAFAGGMSKDTEVLDAKNTDSWQPELKRPVHVLLLLAYHRDDDLARITGKLVEDLGEEDSGFELVFVQEGRAYKNGDGEGIEHFGYVDGRSQPLLTVSAIEDEKKKKGGIDKYDPSAPLSQVLVSDPLYTDGFGSFFVFRKLEQNVAGFKRTEEELGTFLGLKGEDKERAGALVVGRFEDGTPVTLHDEEKGVPVVNNFNYDADAAGSKCPFHAHIRKSNPRGSSPGGIDFDKSVQMARRGITYGCRMQDPVTKELIDQPNDGVGLLFMSYQASIEKQFRFMQTQWVNDEKFPKLNASTNVGVDPVIGQGGQAKQTWNPTWNVGTGTKQSLFQGFVTLKGGDYFFAPSISGLKNL
ncbi:MAG: Dyp-type peroxidase [Burkholderiaceae bacterium]